MSAEATTMRSVELSRRKLRDTDERLRSQLFGTGVTRTAALEALVISAVDEALPLRCIDDLKALGQPPFGQTQRRRSRRPPRADHLLEVVGVSHLAAMAAQGGELAFDGRRDVHAVRRAR
jgi:hypothetical protein